MKKCAAIVKSILDKNGYNYEIEKKWSHITFTLDNQYNELFENYPIYYIITVERHQIIVSAMLDYEIIGDAQVPVSKLLSHIKRDLAGMGDIGIQTGFVYIVSGLPYLKCLENYEIALIMSIPLAIMRELTKWIIAVACGELSVDDAYENMQEVMQGESTDSNFFDVFDLT